MPLNLHDAAPHGSQFPDDLWFFNRLVLSTRFNDDQILWWYFRTLIDQIDPKTFGE